MREGELIDWIRSRSEFDPARVPVGPGDDCAIVACSGQRVLVTTDQLLDGVHVRLAEHGPEAAGRKAMARNLSDIAAMAARPVAAVVTVTLPRGTARADAEAIYRGLRSAADPFDCPLVGGDVGGWDGPLAISVTVFGVPAGATGGIEPVLRSGARPRNALCVTGRLGGAWRTRRHLEFTPRIAEGITIALRCKVRAMIDISDGLTTDLWHLCEASGVGARIEAAAIPIHRDALDAAGGDRENALQMALNDGEDYELLLAVPVGQVERVCSGQWAGVEVTRIGTTTREPGMVLVRPDGTAEPLKPGGWEHRT